MASLRDQFQHFYAPDEDAVATALRTGLVAPDTNVLLSLYRFQSEAREELFGALERIGDRLWIPYQVALEFHRNRLKVIADQDSYFSKTRDELAVALDGYVTKVRAFGKRIALPESDVQRIVDKIRRADKAVGNWIAVVEKANEVHLDNRDSDEVLLRLESLFSNRVGDPMNPDALKAARAEWDKRTKDNIPPGYMDKGKTDSSGDYLLWKQLMSEAALRKLPTILITDDRKEDWYWRVNGRTIGARYELREEMASVAGVPFLIMTTETFLLRAEEYLKISVSPETVSQAKELPGSLERAEKSRMKERYEQRLRYSISKRDGLAAMSAVMRTQVRSLQDNIERGIYVYDSEAADRQRLNAAQAELESARAAEFEVVREIDAIEKALTDIRAELSAS
jgi:hypothetical protein